MVARYGAWAVSGSAVCIYINVRQCCIYIYIYKCPVVLYIYVKMGTVTAFTVYWCCLSSHRNTNSCAGSIISYSECIFNVWVGTLSLNYWGRIQLLISRDLQPISDFFYSYTSVMALRNTFTYLKYLLMLRKFCNANTLWCTYMIFPTKR